MTEYNYAYKYNCIIQCSNLFTAPNKEYIEDFGPCYPLPEISNTAIKLIEETLVRK